ncbi:MAG TPA: hypothetical protein VN643_00665 [Pyrinomonadaceae bacterium]|nr:hypothetical protein [Pyrinomonadaceae bacterium]
MKSVSHLSAEEIKERVTRLAFDGDKLRFREFLKKLENGLPPGTGIALRGSVVTNERWKDGKPFDSDGRGTSDLDVTLVGSKVMEFWDKGAFYIPALHTKPLCDEDDGIAPGLNTLREELQELAERPVNFQATANLVLFARDVLFNEPYVMLIEPE